MVEQSGSKLSKQLPFFIYGTLMPAQPNAYLWQGKVAKVVPATLVGGWLYDMGYFPLLRLAPKDEGQQIEGVLLYPNAGNHQQLLTSFDQLEGYNPKNRSASAYRRVIVPVYVANNLPIKAWVYEGDARLIAGMEPISEGSWTTYIAQKSVDMRQWWEDWLTG